NPNASDCPPSALAHLIHAFFAFQQTRSLARDRPRKHESQHGTIRGGARGQRLPLLAAEQAPPRHLHRRPDLLGPVQVHRSGSSLLPQTIYSPPQLVRTLFPSVLHLSPETAPVPPQSIQPPGQK